jgi:hypothetical protein
VIFSLQDPNDSIDFGGCGVSPGPTCLVGDVPQDLLERVPSFGAPRRCEHPDDIKNLANGEYKLQQLKVVLCHTSKLRKDWVDSLSELSPLPILVQVAQRAPKVVVTALYKSGTNLMANVLRELGYTLSGEGIRHSYKTIRERLMDDRTGRFSLIETLMDITGDSTALFLHQLHLTSDGFSPPCFFDKWVQTYSPPIVFHYRDPRDVLISLCRYLTSEGDAVTLSWPWGKIHRDILMNQPSVESRLDFMIDHADLFFDAAYRRHYWLYNHPMVIKSRFEDLIGESGNGSRESQEQVVFRIIANIGATACPKNISSTLYDDKSRTFRKGQAFGWRSEYSEAQTAKFNEKYADIIQTFGYDD